MPLLRGRLRRHHYKALGVSSSLIDLMKTLELARQMERTGKVDAELEELLDKEEELFEDEATRDNMELEELERAWIINLTPQPAPHQLAKTNQLKSTIEEATKVLFNVLRVVAAEGAKNLQQAPLFTVKRRDSQSGPPCCDYFVSLAEGTAEVACLCSPAFGPLCVKNLVAALNGPNEIVRKDGFEPSRLSSFFPDFRSCSQPEAMFNLACQVA